MCFSWRMAWKYDSNKRTVAICKLASNIDGNVPLLLTSCDDLEMRKFMVWQGLNMYEKGEHKGE